MRRASFVVVMIIVSAVVTGHGQRINSPDEYRQAMKTVGTAVNAGGKSIDSGAYTDAKAPLVLARQSLASSVPFWSEKKIENAVKLTRESVRKLDDLDTALSAQTVDGSAVSKVVSSLLETCNACHAAYREGDSKSGYRIKAEQD